MIVFNDFLQSLYEMAQSDRHRKLCHRAKSRLNEMAQNPSMSVQNLLQQVIDAVSTDPDIADAVRQPLLQACKNTISWMNSPEAIAHSKSQGPGAVIADGPNWKGKGMGRSWRDGASHDVSDDLQRQIRQRYPS